MVFTLLIYSVFKLVEMLQTGKCNAPFANVTVEKKKDNNNNDEKSKLCVTVVTSRRVNNPNATTKKELDEWIKNGTNVTGNTLCKINRSLINDRKSRG